jgi:hypothetical protein
MHASEWVKPQKDGTKRKPTVKIGGQVLAEPVTKPWSRRCDKSARCPNDSRRTGVEREHQTPLSLC